MKLIVNTNILISFFRKDLFTRKLILDFEMLELFTPSFCVEELNRHKRLICEKSKISYREFEAVLDNLLIFVKVSPASEYKEYLYNGKRISPDPDDLDLFALALKLGCRIWSNDKRLKRQAKVKVLSTKELVELLKT